MLDWISSLPVRQSGMIRLRPVSSVVPDLSITTALTYKGPVRKVGRYIFQPNNLLHLQVADLDIGIPEVLELFLL